MAQKKDFVVQNPHFIHVEWYTLFDTMSLLRTLVPLAYPSFWGKKGRIVLNTGRLEGKVLIIYELGNIDHKGRAHAVSTAVNSP